MTVCLMPFRLLSFCLMRVRARVQRARARSTSPAGLGSRARVRLAIFFCTHALIVRALGETTVVETALGELT